MDGLDTEALRDASAMAWYDFFTACWGSSGTASNAFTSELIDRSEIGWKQNGEQPGCARGA